MKGMQPDNLIALKDDMIAFIEGHGMRHFPAVIPEDTPRIWWNDPESTDVSENTSESSKESWKDFVEMAKTTGASMVCIGEDTLDKTTLEMLGVELENFSDTEAFGREMANLTNLYAQAGKLGHIELAFAHQGILFVHETSTKWYRQYREMVETIDTLQELIEAGLDNIDDTDEEQA
jgi:hypothetical protein